MERNISTRQRVPTTQENAPISRLLAKTNLVRPTRNPLNEVQNKPTDLPSLGAAKPKQLLTGPIKPKGTSTTIGLFKSAVTKPQIFTSKNPTVSTKKPVKDENAKPSVPAGKVGFSMKPTLGLRNKPVTLPTAVGLKKTNLAPKTAASTTKPSLLKPHSKIITSKDAIQPKKEVKQDSGELIQKAEKFGKPKSCFDVDLENDPLLVPEYVTDIFSYLKSLEQKYPIPKNHIKTSQVTVSMRAVLVDWISEVCHSFKLVKETLHISVALVDRYLVANKKIDKNTLQLVGVVAMFIASKYEELVVPSLDDWLYVCDYAATRKDLLRMEFDMIKRLDFSLTRPTAISFLRRNHKVVAATGEQHELGKYMIDLALMEYSMCSFPPSLHAAAACCLARFLIKEDIKTISESWCELLEYHTDYTFDDIKSLVHQYAEMLINAETSKYQEIRKIYSQTKYRCISKSAVLTGTKLRTLILKSKNNLKF